MKPIFKRVAIAAATALALGGAVGSAYAEGERFILVSHAPDSDSWWNTIKNIADMARIIEQAAASNPDGIITTLADPDVLSGPIRDAVDSGIPVIIMNSGTPEQAADVGALMYVGQPEYDAGFRNGSGRDQEQGHCLP